MCRELALFDNGVLTVTPTENQWRSLEYIGSVSGESARHEPTGKGR